MDHSALSPFEVAAVLVVVATAFGYLNYRLIRLPHTIGLTIMGAVASLVLVGLDAVWPAVGLGQAVQGFLTEIDFRQTLLEGMLSFLLFAGALHVDLGNLLHQIPPPRVCQGPKLVGEFLLAEGDALIRLVVVNGHILDQVDDAAEVPP